MGMTRSRIRWTWTASLAVLTLLTVAGEAQGQAALLLEPHAGAIRWSGAYDRDLEGLLGGRATLQLTRGFAIGAHYARGFDYEERELTPLQLYGADVTIGLPTLGAVLPFMLVGAAETGNVESEQEPGLAGPAPDLRAVTLGGGFRVPLSGRLSLELTARDLVTSTDGDWPWEVSEFDEIRHNVVFSAGLGFRIGRTATAAGPVAAPPASPPPAPARTPERVIEPPPTAVRDAVSDTFVRIPVPREGEIYIRYGPGESRLNAPQTLTAAPVEAGLLRQLIREELAAAGAVPGSTLTESQLRELEARVIRAVDEIVTRRIREEMEILRRQISADLRDEVARRPLLPAPGPARPGVPRPAAPPPAGVRIGSDAFLFSGASLPAPIQLLLGARYDAGPASARLPALRLMPELSAGVGDGGAAVMVAANLVYGIPALALARTAIRPHVSLGMGILGTIGNVVGYGRAEGVLNFGYGLTVEPEPRSRFALPPGVGIFIEHQGVDLFDNHRLLLGVRRSR
jgi:hypothetical protein